MKMCRKDLFVDFWIKKNSAYQLFILHFLTKLHSKSGTVLAVKGVLMANCNVYIYRNATWKAILYIILNKSRAVEP